MQDCTEGRHDTIREIHLLDVTWEICPWTGVYRAPERIHCIQFKENTHLAKLDLEYNVGNVILSNYRIYDNTETCQRCPSVLRSESNKLQQHHLKLHQTRKETQTETNSSFPMLTDLLYSWKSVRRPWFSVCWGLSETFDLTDMTVL